ncbi:MAG: Argininosuccinate lyase [Candidatus Gottesmanbacteria bacterium GW2011_GWA1_34_13]|uniref:Argininosuccinate lyase n=1 Tax=Candidatus Gottesmanbacteria bacterium GW2011_GWA1_34_13 TaxID=1618434 RepID=A0A0G0ARY7_9BACT|nr:MAG: Argininosuccinate lyase [Candidatus Gottesmanbacteria bacterium GW2011_GWA1_34_13]
MKKLWEKNGSQNITAENYCFSRNTELDNNLIFQDALGSIAHAQMLSEIGILTHDEFVKLKKCLLEIIQLAKSSKFSVEKNDEDVHTKIEQYLTEKLGESGKKIHTGRSRNDQILLDLRLYTKEKLLKIATQTLCIIDTFINFAQKYEFVPMPGYTHMQKAMPSSVGMWGSSFAESLIDDLFFLKTAYEINDQSPLGSGAAYGVTLPIDRELTAKLLGFAKVQNNSLYAQVSRGKSHLIVAQALSQIMLTFSRFAQDILLFSTQEFDFFKIDSSFCTGSSIMPQKKNLDLAEMIRARSFAVLSYSQMIATIISSLPSGYNADFGETKFPLMESINITLSTIDVLNIFIPIIKPNEKKLIDACTPEIYATHQAYILVKQGMPFRNAYKQVGQSLNQLKNFDPKKMLRISKHVGGTGNLGISNLKKIYVKNLNWWKLKQYKFTVAISELMKGQLYE